MSVTYHRLISHKSFKTNNVFKIVGLFLGTVGLTGSALAWCAVHKEHHVHSDTKQDPHSPITQSFFSVQFLSMFYKPKLKYIKVFLNDPLVVFFHKNYFKINFLYALVLFIFDPFALIYAYFFPAFLLWHAGSLINSACHLYGYRNYSTNDHSKNNLVLGYLMWGEGWHNNHHRFPTAANNKVRWFELDISYFFIKMIQNK